jgi:ankyrin repeat protein
MKTKTLFFIVAMLAGIDTRLRADRLNEVIRAGDSAELAELLRAGASPNARDGRGETLLMQAALYGPTDMLKLLLDQGADANGANKAGATALMRAAGDSAKIKLLVEHGADVNARSALGNTPLILAARAHGSAMAVELLVAKGAEVNATNRFGASPILTAAASGDLATVRFLITQGADVNSHSRANEEAVLWGGGRSPLMWAAARGDLAMIELLLKAGARINEEEGFGTALTQAAWMDRTEAARLLLKHGAEVNATERFSGFTALHWAASTETADATLTKLLLKHGANANAEGGEPVDAFLGVPQTPLMLARKRGETSIARALIAAGAEGNQARVKEIPAARREIPEKFTPDFLNAAVDRSVIGLQRSALSSKKAFLNHASKQDCVSCHQQYSPMTALAFARTSGRPVDLTAEESILEMVRRDNTNLCQITIETTFHPEPAHAYGYALFALAARKEPPTPEFDAMVHHLLVIQGKDGQWHNNLPRPPIQTSDVGATALAVHALANYGFPALKREFDERVSRARNWLWRVQPVNTEERVYQILGLAWSGVPPENLRKLARKLSSEQRRDGGWAQLPKLQSDAYATGQALYALHLTGEDAGQKDFQKGLRYLLTTQREDGSWFVSRRAFPFQPTMPAGYSHGRDAWISATASSWAVMALSIGLEGEKPIGIAKSGDFLEAGAHTVNRAP